MCFCHRHGVSTSQYPLQNLDLELSARAFYFRQYLKAVPPILYELEKKISYDQYFLFDIDVPWVADGLRDLGKLRREIFEVFKLELKTRLIDFTFVTGDWVTREFIVKNKLAELFEIQT